MSHQPPYRDVTLPNRPLTVNIIGRGWPVGPGVRKAATIEQL